METETEVFRFYSSDFNNVDCYAFALYTRHTSNFKSEKYYTTNQLQYLGNYVSTTQPKLFGDNSIYTFSNNGILTQIEFTATSCFKVVDCLDDGTLLKGGKHRKKSKKSKKRGRKSKKRGRKSKKYRK